MPAINEIRAYAEQYSLAMGERVLGFTRGELAGKNAGSSVEYQDHKSYFIGDDIRHIDWRAYARTDRLSLKLYREEISPRVDILMDTSMSMGVGETKRGLSASLGYLFYLLGRKMGAAVKIFTTGSRIRQMEVPERIFDVELVSETDFAALLPKSEYVGKSGIKIVISDFLFQLDPSALTNMLWSNSNRLILVQVLSDFENNPKQSGLWRLEDAEEETIMDISLGSQSIEQYLNRLNALREDLRTHTVLGGGAFASVAESKNLQEVMNIFLREKIVTA